MYHRIGECTALGHSGYGLEGFRKLVALQEEVRHRGATNLLRTALARAIATETEGKAGDGASSRELCFTALENAVASDGGKAGNGASASLDGSASRWQLPASVLLESYVHASYPEQPQARVEGAFGAWARLQLVSNVAFDTACYNAMLHNCVISRDAFKGKKVLGRMEAAAVPPDAETYEWRSALHLICRPQEHESAEMALTECLAAGFAPSASFYRSLINQRSYRKQLAEAEQLLDEMQAAGHLVSKRFRDKVKSVASMGVHPRQKAKTANVLVRRCAAQGVQVSTEDAEAALAEKNGRFSEALKRLTGGVETVTRSNGRG